MRSKNIRLYEQTDIQTNKHTNNQTQMQLCEWASFANVSGHKAAFTRRRNQLASFEFDLCNMSGIIRYFIIFICVAS